MPSDKWSRTSDKAVEAAPFYAAEKLSTALGFTCPESMARTSSLLFVPAGAPNVSGCTVSWVTFPKGLPETQARRHWQAASSIPKRDKRNLGNARLQQPNEDK